MTLTESCTNFLAHCRVSRNLSPHTLRAYGIDLSELQAVLGAATPIEDIGRNEIRKFLTFLMDERKLNGTSVKRRMACVKAMFRWLEREEVLETNPFHRMHLALRLPKRLPRALVREDISRLLAAAKRADLAATPSAFLGLLDRMVIELLFTTGMRIGELTAIRVHDVAVDEGRIRIMGKGSRERQVFLVDEAMKGVVRRYLTLRAAAVAATAGDHFLVNSRGSPATPTFIRKRLAKLAETAGVTRKVTPHMLRHTAATQLIEAGVDIRYVQKLLGHHSLTTTELYTQVSDKALREAICGAGTRRRCDN